MQHFAVMAVLKQKDYWNGSNGRSSLDIPRAGTSEMEHRKRTAITRWHIFQSYSVSQTLSVAHVVLAVHQVAEMIIVLQGSSG